MCEKLNIAQKFSLVLTSLLQSTTFQSITLTIVNIKKTFLRFILKKYGQINNLLQTYRKSSKIFRFFCRPKTLKSVFYSLC
jgi:hypothetical protein